MLSFSLRGFLMTFAGLSLLLVACGNKDKGNEMPENFNSLPTARQMEYLMRTMTPDRLAVFICETSIGKNQGVKMNVQEAQDYAYQHLKESDMVLFSETWYNFRDSIPMSDKVKMARVSALDDPASSSYELGLSYTGEIREKKLTAEQVGEQLREIKRICASDTAFYRRFITGFKTALRADRHRDFDDNIYLQFINYPEK